MEKLVLFDIDGTLVDPGGAGRRSMMRTFYEIFSIKDASTLFKIIRVSGFRHDGVGSRSPLGEGQVRRRLHAISA